MLGMLACAGDGRRVMGHKREHVDETCANRHRICRGLEYAPCLVQVAYQTGRTNAGLLAAEDEVGMVLRHCRPIIKEK
jgi:hypothetical protein